MAAFTTMALLGLAAVGGLAAGRRLAAKPQTTAQGAQPGAQTTTAPAAVSTTTPAPVPAPAAASATTTAAGQTATRQRRRSAAGSAGAVFATPGGPAGRRRDQTSIRPQVEPRTLVGY